MTVRRKGTQSGRVPADLRADAASIAYGVAERLWSRNGLYPTQGTALTPTRKISVDVAMLTEALGQWAMKHVTVVRREDLSVKGRERLLAARASLDLGGPDTVFDLVGW